ncbi:hypothetical protein RB595_001566 [Gaeumannomyces hyphopodioides]
MTRLRSEPCMFALSSSLGLPAVAAATEDAPAAPLTPPPPPPTDARGAAAEDDEEAVMASRVKRSLMALSCIRGGSWMCTSGSRTLGCMMVSTVSGCRTRTGMSWVMTFSRSRFMVSSSDSCIKEASSAANGSSLASPPPPRRPKPPPPKPPPPPPPPPPWFATLVVVRMVMERSGMPLFLRALQGAEGQLEVDGVSPLKR